MSIDAYEAGRVANALAEFKAAACELERVMARNNLSEIHDYPEYMPSLEEFHVDVAKMGIPVVL